MATQLEAFRIIAPEFASSDDVTVQMFLDIAPLFIEPMQYSEDTRGIALVYQAASMMYAQKQSANGTSNGLDVTMEKEGDLTRQFGKSNSTSSVASKNIYEQMLEKLGRGIFGTTIMTRYGVSGGFGSTNIGGFANNWLAFPVNFDTWSV